MDFASAVNSANENHLHRRSQRTRRERDSRSGSHREVFGPQGHQRIVRAEAWDFFFAQPAVRKDFHSADRDREATRWWRPVSLALSGLEASIWAHSG
jgi:hypothetical protein